MEQKHPLRQRFEEERRRAAFLAFLPAMGIGVIAVDTWVSPWLGVPGGVTVGLLGYLAVYAYETFMWRRQHGSWRG